jgi:hypothetical protein
LIKRRDITHISAGAAEAAIPKKKCDIHDLGIGVIGCGHGAGLGRDIGRFVKGTRP